MLKARRTWARPVHEKEFHAICAVVFGKLIVSYCGKQWREDDDCETGEHDPVDRCDDCQRAVIEADRVVVGLEELMRRGLRMEGWR